MTRYFWSVQFWRRSSIPLRFMNFNQLRKRDVCNLLTHWLFIICNESRLWGFFGAWTPSLLPPPPPPPPPPPKQQQQISWLKTIYLLLMCSEDSGNGNDCEGTRTNCPTNPQEFRLHPSFASPSLPSFSSSSTSSTSFSSSSTSSSFSTSSCFGYLFTLGEQPWAIYLILFCFVLLFFSCLFFLSLSLSLFSPSLCLSPILSVGWNRNEPMRPSSPCVHSLNTFCHLSATELRVASCVFPVCFLSRATEVH